jgi:hypothetical protein
VYSMYERIAQAIGSNVLQEEWKTALANDLCRPWDGRSLAGHVPSGEVHKTFAALRDACARPGLYVFGAWASVGARVQYVGIAHGKPLRDRLCSRYVGKPGSMSQFSELVMAREFALQFNSVVDDFSPVTRVNVEKYRQAGIPLPHRSRYRRLFRAERWAKIGPDDIWFFLIPARPDVTKEELETVERELIMVSNAAMFRLFSEGAPRAWPLVNVVHGDRGGNPYVEPRLLKQYEAWLSKRSR